MPTPMPLPEVDRVEILTLLDLSLDLLMAGSETVRRVPIEGTVGQGRWVLRAEHGFSSLVTVVQATRKASFLFDAGLTRRASSTIWTSLKSARATFTPSF